MEYTRLFTEKTVDNILNQMLARVPNTMDKREGSVIYDALAPAAVELALLYLELDYVFKNSFADTATREYLILLAKERGIEPKPATFSKLKGVFNIDVPLGSRYSLDAVNYIVEEPVKGELHTYILRAETVGTMGNSQLGKLIPIDNIKGLETATLTEILIPGEDEEETETFRERYMETLRHEAYGGNISDYKKKVNDIDGVGGVKVYPVWNGGGTVKIVFIDSEYNVPTLEMVDKVQEAIDPVPYHQKGVGIAPIGHFVTVEGATWDDITIGLHLTLAQGKTWDEVKQKVSVVLEEYFLELRKSWTSKKPVPLPKETPLVIRISYIESRLLDIEGITDAYDTKINAEAKNYTLAQEKVPKLKAVNLL